MSDKPLPLDHGHRINLLLAICGLSIEDVATRLGVMRTTIKHWQGGEDIPEAAVRQLADLTGSTPWYIRYGIGPATEGR